MTFNLFDLIIAIESITSNDWTKLSDSIGTLIKLNVIPIRETQRKFQLQLKVIASLHHCIIASTVIFHSILFHSISIQFYSISILFHFNSIPFCSILFCSVLFCSVWKTKGRSWGELFLMTESCVMWFCEKW